MLMPKATHGLVSLLKQEPLSSTAKSHVFSVPQFKTNYCESLIPASLFVFERKYFCFSHNITQTLEHSACGLTLSPINTSRSPQGCHKTPDSSHCAHFPDKVMSKLHKEKKNGSCSLTSMEERPLIAYSFILRNQLQISILSFLILISKRLLGIILPSGGK